MLLCTSTNCEHTGSYRHDWNIYSSSTVQNTNLFFAFTHLESGKHETVLDKCKQCTQRGNCGTRRLQINKSWHMT